MIQHISLATIRSSVFFYSQCADLPAYDAYVSDIDGDDMAGPAPPPHPPSPPPRMAAAAAASSAPDDDADDSDEDAPARSYVRVAPERVRQVVARRGGASIPAVAASDCQDIGRDSDVDDEEGPALGVAPARDVLDDRDDPRNPRPPSQRMPCSSMWTQQQLPWPQAPAPAYHLQYRTRV